MCKCKDDSPNPGRGTHSVETTIAGEPLGQPIKTTIQPGFDHKVAIRLVPGRELFRVPEQAGCQPRGERPPSPWPWGLSPDLTAQLADANTKVVAWLASSEDNAAQFVDDPVGALERAGVELSRAGMKAVSRSHAAVRQDAVLPPGATLSLVAVKAVQRGKVGDVGGAPPDRAHVGPSGPSELKPTRRTCGC